MNGASRCGPLARSIAWAMECLSYRTLGALRSAGAMLVDLRAEADGPISGFGDRLAGVIGPMLVGLGVPISDEVVEITYEDRYLKSPAIARLCLDTLSKLKGSSTKVVPVRINTFLLEPSTRPTQWLGSDWRREDDRLGAMKFYATAHRLKLDIQLTHPEHGRRLALHLKSGRALECCLTNATVKQASNMAAPPRSPMAVLGSTCRPWMWLSSNTQTLSLTLPWLLQPSPRYLGTQPLNRRSSN